MPATEAAPPKTARVLDAECLGPLAGAVANVKTIAEKVMLDLRAAESRGQRPSHDSVTLEQALVELGGAISWAEIQLLTEQIRTGHLEPPDRCLCGRQASEGCLQSPVSTPSGNRAAVAWGDEPWREATTPCPSCGTTIGKSHHVGCPQAACPACGGRVALSCTCSARG